jgi:potassium efflux system protein
VIQSKLDRGVQLAAWVLWIVAVLDSGGQLAPVLSGLESLAASTLPIPGAEVELGNLLGSGLLLYFTFLLSRLIRFILAEEIFPRLDLPKGSPYAISALTHYTVLTLGFVLAANALGLGLNRFTLLAGAFGVGIGFGLQTIVNNFVSGIILLTERPVEVGDTISLSGAFGEVGRIGIRSSTVRTWQGAEIIVPNADLIAQQVTNWTLSDRRRRLEIQVGVAYGSQPRQVIEVLKQAATRVDRVLTEPEPYVLFTGFGDSSLDFELRCWTDDFDRFLQVRSSVCVEVSDLLAQAGIVIPFPQRDLHIRDIARGDAEEPPNPSDRGHDSIDGNETD